MIVGQVVRIGRFLYRIESVESEIFYASRMLPDAIAERFAPPKTVSEPPADYLYLEGINAERAKQGLVPLGTHYRPETADQTVERFFIDAHYEVIE